MDGRSITARELRSREILYIRRFRCENDTETGLKKLALGSWDRALVRPRRC